MKIIQLITSINIGGSEIVAFNLTEFTSDNINFTLVEIHSSTDQYARDKKAELRSKKIKFQTLGNKFKRLSLLIAPLKLFNLILNEKPDIVHSHTDLPDFVLAITMKLFRLFKISPPKIIRTIHNNELWPTHHLIGKIVESNFKDDFIVGVSESSLMAHNKLRIKYNLIPSPNQQVIYNGCRIPINKHLGIKLKSDKINMAFCGRFEIQKGVDILLDRIQEINLKYQKNIDFHFIGNGSLSDRIEEFAEKFDNIKKYLPINNISDKIHEFDFLIMPSRFEGLVLISMEASLARVPVIASKAKGLSETLPNNWILNFDLYNSISLLNLLDKIVKNEFNIENLKNEAENYVKNKYSHKKMISSYALLYKSVQNPIKNKL